MRKADKIWVKIALVLILSGLILAASSFALIKDNVEQLGTDPIVQKNYEIEKNIERVEFKTEISHITIVPSTDNQCHIKVDEWDKYRHVIDYKDGTLTIGTKDTRSWFEHISFNLGEMAVRIQIPAESVRELQIDSDTGRVEIAKGFHFTEVRVDSATASVTMESSLCEKLRIHTETGRTSLIDVTAGEADIRTETGHVSLEGVNAQELNIRTSTGSVELQETRVDGLTALETSTGSIRFENFDAGTMDVTTSTGSVKGNLLSGKNFDVKSSTGKIQVPENSEGGKCRIRTSTGSVEITAD